jgi:hypothetical protein
MKINTSSANKDYYDYLAHVYGVDTNIVYNRIDLIQRGNKPKSSWPQTKKEKEMYEKYREGEWNSVVPVFVENARNMEQMWFSHFHNDYYSNRDQIHDGYYGWISICGNIFPVVKVRDNYSELVKCELILPDTTPKTYQRVWHHNTVYNHKKQRYENRRRLIDYEQTCIDMVSLKTHPLLDEISRQLKQPVFLIQNYKDSKESRLDMQYDIYRYIPNLAELGLPKFIDADSMYKCITAYFQNVINTSPDKEPPAEVDNKQKILQHGFDTKISFRHRV